MIAAAFIVLAYCILVFILVYGWNKATLHAQLNGQPDPHVLITLIVPVRNDAHHLKNLLKSIPEQTYKPIEIIIVDDHSEDDLYEVIQASGLPNHVLVSNAGVGKKQAITTGVNKAKGEIIVTTDADCTMPSTWIETMVSAFQEKRVELAFGLVRIQAGRDFFSSVQAIEFASLIGSGVAAAMLGNPVMCNGANLAYRKQAFIKVNGYEGNLDVPSGDDEFLMRKIHKVYPNGVACISKQAALVTTQPQPDLRSFFSQRIRWASKWKRNSSLVATLLAVFIFSSQVAFAGVGFSLFFSFSWLSLSVILIKFTIEGFFLTSVCRFTSVRWSVMAFILLQFLYPLYVLATALLSFILPYAWKGRTKGGMASSATDRVTSRY